MSTPKSNSTPSASTSNASKIASLLDIPEEFKSSY